MTTSSGTDGFLAPSDPHHADPYDAGPHRAALHDAEPRQAAPHDQQPADGVEAPADDVPRYTVAAVARRLGVAPATLRTWARRYGLGPAQHASGSHRRYSEADVRLLRAVRRVVQTGVPPAEAAQLVLEGRVPLQPEAPSAADAWSPPDDAATEVRGLVRAAVALDDDSLLHAFRSALDRDGVVGAWQGLMVPVLQAVGERWATTGEGVEVEHLASDCAAAALRAYAVSSRPGSGEPSVLLACAEDERHGLPLVALAAALGQRGVATRSLGAEVPCAALSAAVRRTGPSAVFLWAHAPDTGRVENVHAVPDTRPRTTVVVGGPGWPDELPGHTRRADALANAVELLLDVA